MGLVEEGLTSLVAPQAPSSNVPLNSQDLASTNVLKNLPSTVAPPFLLAAPQDLPLIVHKVQPPLPLTISLAQILLPM